MGTEQLEHVVTGRLIYGQEDRERHPGEIIDSSLSRSGQKVSTRTEILN